jgi:hypothetical protein
MEGLLEPSTVEDLEKEPVTLTPTKFSSVSEFLPEGRYTYSEIWPG